MMIPKRVAQAALCTAAMVLTAPALAGSYAVSINDITSFRMGFTPSGASFGGFTFNSNNAVLAGIGSDSDAGSVDAVPSCVGTTCAAFNNSFVSHGAAGSDYAYGDTLIGNTDVLAGTGAASAVGETYMTGALGSASGTNTMIGTLSLSTPTSISFSFTADPYLSTLMSPGGISASASLTFSISIRTGAGIEVFNWTPNGSVGTGVTGGSETADPFSLNTGVGAGAFTYDPVAATFGASSNLLASGGYQISISMSNTAFAESVVPPAVVPPAPVPVPAAVWLFGSGLVGMIAVARRRR